MITDLNLVCVYIYIELNFIDSGNFVKIKISMYLLTSISYVEVLQKIEKDTTTL